MRRQAIHPEPFSVYPPPFSDTAVVEPPVEPFIVTPQPPISLPETEPMPDIGTAPSRPDSASLPQPVIDIAESPVAPPPPAPVAPPVAIEPQITGKAPHAIPADNALDVPAFLRRRPTQWTPFGQPVAGPSFVPHEPARPDAGTTEIVYATSVLGAYNLPQDVFATIYSLTKQNMRIAAIRVLREHTGLGLAEAKDAIDRLAVLVGAKPTQAQCYIATACYGDGNHPDVVTLRRFRDDTLLTNVWGRAFVRVYYALSPGIARRLGPDAVATTFIRRRLLEPFVGRLRV